MKKLTEKAREYTSRYNQVGYGIPITKEAVADGEQVAFMYGAEIAQEWFLIQKDGSGFATPSQAREMLDNLPFLIKGSSEIEEICHELDNDINREKYTHWRPLNRK